MLRYAVVLTLLLASVPMLVRESCFWCDGTGWNTAAAWLNWRQNWTCPACCGHGTVQYRMFWFIDEMKSDNGKDAKGDPA